MIAQNITELNWYALYTKPRFEKKVSSLLCTNNFNSYLPLVSTIKQWSDRKKKVELPLISSYVFVRTNEKDLKNTLPIHGVVGILKHLGKPAIIKDFEIENLKILLEDSSKFSIIQESNLKKGDTVIVEKGVFSGLVAECIKFNGKHRLIVRIDALANIIEVNIPLSYVKKMS
jgi:transcription antitermination factor NusG